MTATIIDGKALACQIRSDLRAEVAELTQAGHQPTLAVVLIGEDPASCVYVRSKTRACIETGIRSLEYRLPEDTPQSEVLTLIDELNNNASVDGILVQLPVPAQIDARAIIKKIAPQKDVDGFHFSNIGALLTGEQGFIPCTPYGVMQMLESTGTDLAGKHAVIVGRSNIVGKPLAFLLLEQDASVTITHSKTKNLAEITRQGDILIAAVGRPKFVTAEMIKPGAIVIDVGINRDDNGKLCGDVNTEQAMSVASMISPVPGGVGPMTIAMLMKNTTIAAKNFFNDSL